MVLATPPFIPSQFIFLSSNSQIAFNESQWSLPLLPLVADYGHCSRPAVQRIVITSSMAAIMEPKAQPTTFSEKDWNNISLMEIETKGREATPLHKYRASKTLAEKGERAL